MGSSSPLIVELWGIHGRLKLVVECGYKNVIIESDSKEAVAINNKISGKKLLNSNLVLQIHNWISNLKRVEIHHIYQEINSCANPSGSACKEVKGWLCLLFGLA